MPSSNSWRRYKCCPQAPRTSLWTSSTRRSSGRRPNAGDHCPSLGMGAGESVGTENAHRGNGNRSRPWDLYHLPPGVALRWPPTRLGELHDHSLAVICGPRSRIRASILRPCSGLSTKGFSRCLTPGPFALSPSAPLRTGSASAKSKGEHDIFPGGENMTYWTIALAVPLFIYAGCGGLFRASLNSPWRARWQQPEAVVRALTIPPGSHVADLGAGGGYFTFRLADAVGPLGKVYAVDVDKGSLDYVARRAKELGYTNVETVLAKYDDPLLPEG